MGRSHGTLLSVGNWGMARRICFRVRRCACAPVRRDHSPCGGAAVRGGARWRAAARGGARRCKAALQLQNALATILSRASQQRLRHSASSQLSIGSILLGQTGPGEGNISWLKFISWGCCQGNLEKYGCRIICEKCSEALRSTRADSRTFPRLFQVRRCCK